MIIEDSDIKLLLRDALAAAPEPESATEIVARAGSERGRDLESRVGRRRPVRILIALSAVAALIIVLIATAWSGHHSVVPGDDPSSTIAKPTSIGDPLSINLDSFARAAGSSTEPAPAYTYLIPDLSSLPSGWTIVSRSGGNSPGPNVTGRTPAFQWRVMLQSPAGATFALFVQDIVPIDPLPDDQTVELPDGTVAHLGGMGLTWNLGSGAQVSLQRGDHKGNDELLIDLARQLQYVEVDHLPLDLPAISDAPPGDGLATFAGRLNGVPWQVNVTPGDLRSAFITVAGQSVGGFSNDRLSQPDNSPAWYATIVGGGTPGAVAVGYAPPTVAAVHLELGTGDTVALPVVRRANDTWFAAPLPTGLNAVDFVFLDDLGHAVRTANVPAIPPDPSGSRDMIVG